MPLKLTRRRLFRTAVLLLLLLVLVCMFDAWYEAFDHRFARSQSELESFATVAMAGDPSKPLVVPTYIGSFEAGDAFRFAGGFAFRSDFGHPFDWNGLAYSARALPSQLPDTHPPYQTMVFERVTGNWYKVWRN